MRPQSILVLFVLVLFLSVALATAIPATTHDVTFVNNAGQTIWVNVQGGPKGVCTGVNDTNTGQDKKCTVCSMCDPDIHGNRSLCNVSETTGSIIPPSCPGMLMDKNYCWDGTACGTGCCGPNKETATGGLNYNCPGSGMYTGCQYDASTTANKSVVDGLSGYNNVTNNLHRIVSNGTLLGDGNITLAAGQTLTFPLRYGWQGAFYPRTNCVFDANGVGSCETGNCKNFLGDSVRGCGGAGSANPVTKAELNLDDNGDWFDVSYVNGFNVGVTIEPGDVNLGSDNCHAAGCAVGLADFHSIAVPDISPLQFKSNGKVVGIWSDCDLYTLNTTHDQAILDGYCCPYPPYVNSTIEQHGNLSLKICAGENSHLYPFTVPGTLPNSAKLFFDTCPGYAYTYAYNDSVPNRQCHSPTGKISNYTITFYRPDPALTLPGSANSGGSASPPSSGPASSTIAIASGGSPGQELTLTFGQVTQAGSPIAVSRISLTPSGGVEPFSLLAKPVTLGSALQISGRPVAGYVEISPIGVNPSSVDFHIIRFSVSGSWLADNEISPGSIVLSRFHDNQWNDLPTTPAGTSGTDFLFDADTPGFSYFAVTVNQSAGAGAATTSGTPAPAITAGDTPASAGTLAETPVTRTAVTARTTVPPAMQQGAEPASPSSSPLSPLTVVIAIAAVVVVTASALIARRWWIRKQNPALFKKYD